MELLCPTCGNSISSADIDSDHPVATCRACGSMTNLDHFASQGVGTRARPSSTCRNPQEVPRPRHISVEDYRHTLRISFRWRWRGLLGPLKMCIIWNGFVVLWCWNALRNGGEFTGLAVIICIPHAALGLFLAYATLAQLLNRTLINLTTDSLTVRHGPVPWWGNRNLPTRELERLECCKDTAPEYKGALYAYKVYAVTKGGGKEDLVSDLDRASALFIKQQLLRWLMIDNNA